MFQVLVLKLYNAEFLPKIKPYIESNKKINNQPSQWLLMFHYKAILDALS